MTAVSKQICMFPARCCKQLSRKLLRQAVQFCLGQFVRRQLKRWLTLWPGDGAHEAFHILGHQSDFALLHAFLPNHFHSPVLMNKQLMHRMHPGLPLGAEAPIMTPSGVDFSFSFLGCINSHRLPKALPQGAWHTSAPPALDIDCPDLGKQS